MAPQPRRSRLPNRAIRDARKISNQADCLRNSCNTASRSLATAAARDPPFCSVARLSKDSRGIGQMEHSVTLAPAGASGGQRSGRLRALPPPARGAPRGSARRPAVSRGSVPGRDPWRDRIRQLRVPHPIRLPLGAAEPAAIQLGHAGRRTSFPAGSPDLALPGARCTTRSRRRLRPGTGRRWRRGTGGQHKGTGHSMLTSRYCRTERPGFLPGRVSPRRCYPAGGGCWPAARSLPVSRSATNTFCSMCQSSGCLAIPPSNTLASCWVMAAIFSCPVPVPGTGISW